MKSHPRALVLLLLAFSLLWVVAYARQLGAREAREGIARALGLDNANDVRIKNIGGGVGGQAIVEATIETAFRFSQDKEGNWNAVEVRAGDRRWESIELMQTALRKEKTLRTTADLRTLATALEAFRKERGFYVVADTGAALVDNLSPRYLNTVLRLDAWSHEFAYNGTQNSYRLASHGPDGKPDTDDDIVIENGRLVRGAAE
ncbi:MAG TPA: type II secretion system protein GspG [Blastocatellia bacterium]|nr:type II secretion system protein GspG [Blastocatellia bacterium]